MLAVGWTVERTREGEALVQQRENEKLRCVSNQVNQVRLQHSVGNTWPIETIADLGKHSLGCGDGTTQGNSGVWGSHVFVEADNLVTLPLLS